MGDTEEKIERGDKKQKKQKSRQTKTASTTQNTGKAKKRRSKTRENPIKSSSVAKSLDDSVGNLSTKSARVRRTNRRLASRGRKVAPGNVEDSAKSKPTKKLSRRRADSDGPKSPTGRRRVPNRKPKASATNKAKTRKTKEGNIKENKTKTVIKNPCSICEEAEATTGGMCQHRFCFRCLKKSLSKTLKKSGDNINHLSVPTKGRCPKCKSEVCKFQMRVCKDGIISEELAFADHKKRVKDSPISGMSFVPKLGDDPRFCLDGHQPYIDVKKAVDADMDSWVLNDGYPVPDRLNFEEDCFFDEETRTFHGKVKWPVTYRGAYQWDVVLAFKKGYKTMDVGIIHERKERVLDEETLKGKSEEEIVRLLYPFDGTWELSWRNRNEEEKIAKVTVRNNQFQRGQNLFNLIMSDPSKVLFRWPGDLVTAEVTSGADLTANPMGPEIGDVINWKTYHQDFPHGFTWERLTIGERPMLELLYFGVGGNDYVARKELVSSSHSTAFDDSDTRSESNSFEPDDDDEGFLRIMRETAGLTPAIPLDYNFGILSTNSYYFQDDYDETKSRGSVIGAPDHDPLLRDLLSSRVAV